jgi:hypothetical protein
MRRMFEERWSSISVKEDRSMSGRSTAGSLRVGIRHEDRSSWERRAPITPLDAARLAQQHDITLHVQHSPTRAFSDDEYRAAGVTVAENLTACPVILAVKEIPADVFERGKTYVFFSHVTKGQRRNMPMLRRILELGCNLIDYERVVDTGARRSSSEAEAASPERQRRWGRWPAAGLGGNAKPSSTRHAHEYHDLLRRKRMWPTPAKRSAGGILEESGLVVSVTAMATLRAGSGKLSSFRLCDRTRRFL